MACQAYQRFSTLNAPSNGHAEVIVGRGVATELYEDAPRGSGRWSGVIQHRYCRGTAVRSPPLAPPPPEYPPGDALLPEELEPDELDDSPPDPPRWAPDETV